MCLIKGQTTTTICTIETAKFAKPYRLAWDLMRGILNGRQGHPLQYGPGKKFQKIDWAKLVMKSVSILNGRQVHPLQYSTPGKKFQKIDWAKLVMKSVTKVNG